MGVFQRECPLRSPGGCKRPGPAVLEALQRGDQRLPEHELLQVPADLGRQSHPGRQGLRLGAVVRRFVPLPGRVRLEADAQGVGRDLGVPRQLFGLEELAAPEDAKASHEREQHQPLVTLFIIPLRLVHLRHILEKDIADTNRSHNRQNSRYVTPPGDRKDGG
eukprot:scaffold153893_cov37-Prasinocladus_malaysianus.AAC.1